MFSKTVFEIEKKETRYTLTKIGEADYNVKTDCNGKQYFNVKFYAKTKKGNVVLFNERRLNELDAKKKVEGLNNGGKEIKAIVNYCEKCDFDNESKKLIYGHALTADYIK